MDCKACQRLLSAYLDHELGLEQALAVEEHLGACVLCAQRFAEERSIAALVREHFPRAPMPPALPHRIRAALPLRERFGSVAIPAGLLAALAVLALAWSFFRTDGMRPQPPVQVREAVALHHAKPPLTGAQALRTSDPSAASQWLRAHLQFVPENVLRAPAGAELVGVQLARIDGREAGWARYHAGGEKISLFLLPAAPLPPSNDRFAVRGVEFRAFRWQGERAIVWNHDALSYILIADSNRGTSEALGFNSPPACAVCHSGVAGVATGFVRHNENSL